MRGFAVCVALALWLTGCRTTPVAPASVSVPALVCAGGERAMVRETLYFGRSRPGGGVSDVEWQSFLDDAVTPRFPDGFTALQGRGQWRDGHGAIVAEPSALLVVLHDGGADATRMVGDIAEEYRRRFDQEAVLRERGAVCARF